MIPPDPPPDVRGDANTDDSDTNDHELKPPAHRPGTSTFTIEGRQAPALFVIGWIATILGVGLVAVAILSGGAELASLLLVVGLVLLAIGLIAGAGSQGIERRARGGRRYAGPSPLLVFAASIPVSILVGVVLAFPLNLVGVALDGAFGSLLAVSIQAIVYVSIVRLLVVDTGALDWHAMGIRKLDMTALREMGGGALAAVPVVAATTVVSVILLRFFPVTPVSPLPPTGEALGFALSLLAGVIIAPLGEEILFRAFATTAWVRSLGERRGIVTAALVFALAHVLTINGTGAGEAFGLAVVGFGARVPVALALGWLFVRRGTIWASFGLHAAFNAVLLILAEVANRAL